MCEQRVWRDSYIVYWGRSAYIDSYLLKALVGGPEGKQGTWKGSV
jgi:hypothetical protein